MTASGSRVSENSKTGVYCMAPPSGEDMGPLYGLNAPTQLRHGGGDGVEGASRRAPLGLAWAGHDHGHDECRLRRVT